MKSMVLMFLITSNVLALEVDSALTCTSKSSPSYEVMIQRLSVEGNDAVVTLTFEGEIVGQEQAVFLDTYRESLPPQTITTFNFVEDQEFMFLEVNKTKAHASMKPGFVDQRGEIISIEFETCDF